MHHPQFHPIARGALCRCTSFGSFLVDVFIAHLPSSMCVRVQCVHGVRRARVAQFVECVKFVHVVHVCW